MCNTYPVEVDVVNRHPLDVRVDGTVDVDVQRVRGAVYIRDYE